MAALFALLAAMTPIAASRDAVADRASSFLASPAVSVAPSSGPIGSTAQLSGSGWATNTAPYQAFWDAEGGTPLGSFTPTINGTWTMQILIPKGDPGKHFIVACQGYGLETRLCASASFTLTQPPASTPVSTSTRTPAPTRTATFAPSPAPATPAGTFNPNGPTSTSIPAATATPTVPPTMTPPPSATPTSLPELSRGTGGPCTAAPAGAQVVSFDAAPLGGTVSASRDAFAAAEFTANVLTTVDGRASTTGAALQRPSDARGPLYGQARAVRLATSILEPLAPASWSTVGMFVSMPAGGDPFRLAAYDGYGREVAAGVVDGGEISLDWACVSVTAPRIVAVRMTPVSSFSVAVKFDDFFFVPEESPVPYHDELEITSPADSSTTTRAAIIEGSVFTNRPPSRVDLWVRTEGSRTGAYFAFLRAVGIGPFIDSDTGSESLQIEPDPASIFRYRFTYTNTRPPAGTQTYDAFLADGLLLERDAVHYAEDSVTITFIAPTPTATPTAVPTPRTGPFNVNVRAFEVTQGVRGDIPSRPVDGGHFLFETDAHVADRTTVVRVYPWVQFTDSVGFAVDARLRAFRGGVELPGSPLAPIAPLTGLQRAWTIDDLRGNAARSWNFRLPSAWTTAGTIDLRAELNPAGARYVDECSTVRGSLPVGASCAGSADNTTELRSVRFVDANGLTFRIIASQNHRAGTTGTAASTGMTPSFDDLARSLDWVWKTYPIADLGISVPSIRGVAADCLGTTGDCDELAAAHTVARADAARLGVTDGSRTLFPIIVNPGTGRGCSGQAGLPNPVYWQGACGPTLAQETFHAGGGVNHSGNSHLEIRGGGSNPLYPNMHGAVESNAFGFDLLALQAIPPTDPCDTGHTHDFMSYGCSPWVSVYTWQGIAAWLARAPDRAEEHVSRTLLVSMGAPRAAVVEEALLVTGRINPSGVIAVDAPVYVEVPPDAPGGSGPLAVEMVAPSGEVLYARSFRAGAILHAPAGNGEFTLLLPRQSDVARVRLLSEGSPVLDIPALPALAPPSFTVDSIPSQLAASGDVTIAWEAATPGLTYTLEIGPTTDGTWETLGRTRSTSLNVDLASLPADCACRFRLQATDGVNVAVIENPVRTGTPAPQAAILSPSTGFVRPGLAVRLMGIALGSTSAEDVFEWRVDDGVVAFGAAAEIDPLPEGPHHLVLRVTRGGVSSDAAVDIDVAADSDGDGLPDEWERTYGLDPLDPQDAAADEDGDNLLNWQELSYVTHPDRRDTDGDGYADDIEISGGGNPADAESLPRAIHGVQGLPVPRISGDESLPSAWWWLYAGAAVVAGGAIIAWQWRRRRPIASVAATPGTPGDPDRPGED